MFHAAHSAKNDYICFFTDDDIFYNKFECDDYDFLNDNNVSCLSLRMGLNITERYHAGEKIVDVPPQVYQTENGMIAWPKTVCTYGKYWSYDLSVDGHIFTRSSILEMIDELYTLQKRYQWGNTPNVLESAMQRFWAIGPNFMISPQHSVVVNSPNNRVQETHADNASGEKYDYSSETLLEKYNSGARINIDDLDFSDIKCPHTELDILKGI